MGSMESCCATLTVTGGTYDRSYDGVSNLSEAGIDCCLDSSNPATVSTFQLDQYEVTVGRFRQFVDAVIAGWAPCPGSGKHSHLNGGKGLAVPGGAYEQGWNASWTGLLATDTSGWNANLSCDSFYESWTPTPASNEALPMNCADWYEMYAFCIWDGGFLPSEAEWNYAAAGGAQQRVYPWSVPPTAMAAGCKYANYSAATPECFLSNPEVVTVYAKVGVGLFGQQNLAGNVAEFALDWYQPYANPCIDCAGLATPDAGEGGVASRVVRGGSFYDTAPLIHTGTRQGYPPTARVDSSQVAATFGARCARAP
jgi:formylglycine-generating enzyme required for sulfatase activity